MCRHKCNIKQASTKFILKRRCHDNPCFWQQFCVGENNGGHKARPWKTTICQGKQQAWAVKLFARLTELSWSDVRDTCASSRHYFLAQKSTKKITEYRDTAPLTLVLIYTPAYFRTESLSLSLSLSVSLTHTHTRAHTHTHTHENY